MILAAADCGQGKGSPPELLRLAWQCKEWSTLPEAGGLRDQPAGLMSKMTQLNNVWQAYKRWKETPSDKVDELIKRYPDDVEIRSEVDKLRKDGKKQ